ncbi:trihelix transcription factor ENAP1-like [Oryza glaberrima]|uniref:Myb/SANT-like DNA-binding domain-containing protein n=2 Tax=Oryza TaxID=4527 RepID=A0A0E0B6I2_9ORYZ|nr:trihelix transcription factor ENAP1-like [Oryza glaberrima]
MDALPDAADAAPLAAAAAPPQKRDEWSESGIVRLLEAYEAKWLLRNRAKLKWSDWVDIAHEVSAHCAMENAAAAAATGKPGSSTAKTPNQCKNKIESMKKRYRAESAAAARAGPAAAGAGPSWRFFARMDGLLKGPAGSGQPQAELSNSIDLRAPPPAKVEVDVDADFVSQLADAGPGALSELVSAYANGSIQEKLDKVENSGQVEGRAAESDVNVSSPRIKEANEDAEEVDKVWDMSKKRKNTEFDIAKSIELLASSFLKIERARMDLYRETERMRVEAEIKKGEMELKRTEIMAKTHLQIAKLFAKRLKECSSKTGGSSSVTAEVDNHAKKGENGSG